MNKYFISFQNITLNYNKTISMTRKLKYNR